MVSNLEWDVRVICLSYSSLVEVDGSDDKRHPFRSLIIGNMGPYVPFPSHSFLSYLGPQVYILLLDCRYVLRTKEAYTYRY